MVKAPEIQSSDQKQQHQLLNKKLNQLSMANDVSSTPTTSSTLSQQHQSTPPLPPQSVVTQSVPQQVQSGLIAKSTVHDSNSSSSISINNKNVNKSSGKEAGKPSVQAAPITSTNTASTSMSTSTATSTAAIAVVAPTTRSGSSNGGSVIVTGGIISDNVAGSYAGISINTVQLTSLKLNGPVLTPIVTQPQIMSAHAQRIPHGFQHLSQFPVPPPGGGGPWPAAIVEPAFHFGPGFEPQTHHYCPTHSQPSEHVVFFHVNPGVSVSFQVGSSREIVRGEL